MKHLYIICIILATSYMAQAQERVSERVFVHLDKDCYMAGEDMWAKFYVTDQRLQPSGLSKVGYIEICDTEKPQIQYILALEEGKGSGKVRIPTTMPTGIYELTGYTRYMRNEEENVLFKREIAIVNMFQQSEADRLELVEPTDIQWKRESNISGKLQAITDKGRYRTRSQVSLTLSDLPQDVTDLVISVTRNDSITPLNETDMDSWSRKIKANVPPTVHRQWEPEYEGHILTGRIHPVDESDGLLNLNDLKFSIGFVGKDIRYIPGRMIAENKTARFYTENIYGQQEIVTSVVSGDNKKYRLDLLSPFGEQLPTILSMLKIQPENSRLTDRFIGVQLQQILVVDSIGRLTPFSYYNLRSHLRYDLDEYTRFNTMQETFIEFVRRITISRIQGKRVLKVFYEDDTRYNAGNTLVLLDGIPVHNHEDILAYNPRLVKTIDIFSGRYLFGGEAYECMISFVTHRGDLPSMKLSDGSQLLVYNCPSLSEVFNSPDYSAEERRKSRYPDYRHTLYWNPYAESAIVNNAASFSFYTSDLKGEFQVTIEGITRGGEVICGTAFFNVE